MTQTTQEPNSDSSIKRDTSQNGKISPVEFLGVASFVCLTLLAFLCVLQKSLPSQPMSQLLLVAISFSTALLTMRDRSLGSVQHQWLLISKTAFVAVASVALILWAPNLAFALLIVCPIVAALAIPFLLERLGIEWSFQSSERETERSSVVVQNGGSQNQLAKTVEQSLNERSPVESALEPQDTNLSNDLSNELLLERAAIEQTNSLNESGDSQNEGMIDSDLDEQDVWSGIQNQFSIDSSLQQNLTRWSDEGGNQCVTAHVRCTMTTADETCVVHIPFWPILVSTPTVLCRVVEGPQAQIKSTETRSHGLRVEVQLTRSETPPALPCQLVIEIVASALNDSKSKDVAA